MFTTAYRFCRDDGKVEDVVFVRGERVAVGLCYGCDRPRCWLIIVKVKGGRPGLRRPTSENPNDDKQLKFQMLIEDVNQEYQPGAAALIFPHTQFMDLTITPRSYHSYLQ